MAIALNKEVVHVLTRRIKEFFISLFDVMLDAAGLVTGVIPETLIQKEVAHEGLSELRVVHSMHERKALMAELSVGFVGLPGGLGTLEEFFEVLTWAQLGLHDKPCGLLNVAGYFDGLVQFLDHAVEEGFLRPNHRSMPFVEADPERLLDQFERHAPTREDKWPGRDLT